MVVRGLVDDIYIGFLGERDALGNEYNLRILFRANMKISTAHRFMDLRTNLSYIFVLSDKNPAWWFMPVIPTFGKLAEAGLWQVLDHSVRY